MSTCKICGAEIGWKKTAKGKWCPTNADGSPHFSACKRKKAPTGPAEVRSAGWFRGKHYVELTCECPVPPWEVCTDCPNRERIRGWKEPDEQRAASV